MELFLEELAQCFDWTIWCFAHYHADRLERPYVEQFYRDTENIEELWERWNQYSKTKELDWWLDKSQNFHMTDILTLEENK